MNNSIELEIFLEENKEIFDGLGTFPDIMTIKLTKGAIPIANFSRRVSLAVKSRLGETFKLLINKRKYSL